VLESIERNVYSAHRQIAAGPGDDFPVNCGPESAVPQAQQRQEHELLELPDCGPRARTLHISNIVWYIKVSAND
jgi:hypothetical protein